MKVPARPAEYQDWRAARLQNYPREAGELLVDIGGLTDLGPAEKDAIVASFRRANLALYACRDKTADRAAVRQFSAQFGLKHLDHHLCANDDGVAELTVATEGQRGGYVPYSNRSLSWHTDGYYNDAHERVHAVVLHCAQDARSGGQNAVLDPEIAYILLRDEDPQYIRALEHPECMTIPANISAQEENRPAVCGPVFSHDGPGGNLQMRYSARKKNILWRDDQATTAARAFLHEILESDDGPVMRFRLLPGQGLISNNVLHNRTAFEDAAGTGRLVYRARFFDRVESS